MVRVLYHRVHKKRPGVFPGHFYFIALPYCFTLTSEKLKKIVLVDALI